MKLKEKTKALQIAAAGMRIACLGSFVWTLAKFYRFAFATGWDWQNPVAALPEIAPIIIGAVAVIALYILADVAEIKAIDLKQRAEVRAAFARAQERARREA